MDIKAMMNKYSVWIDSMPRIPSPRWIARPEAGGVLDKPKASERDSLMDFKPVTAEFEAPSKSQNHLQQNFNQGCDELGPAMEKPLVEELMPQVASLQKMEF